MSIFGKIKSAIFGNAAQAAEPARSETAPAPTQAPAAPHNPAAAAPAPAPAASVAPAPAPAAPAAPAGKPVDVAASLEAMAKANGSDLNWQSSIVDLMKLLGIDSSLPNRKELAKELNYTGELDGSAEMNIWLHKAVMRELAKNGGDVPAHLKD